MECYSTPSMQRILREIHSLSQKPPEGIRIVPMDDNILNICAEIDGPVQTPYDGGVFRIKLILGEDYPQTPPKGFFLTKIFHPNISKTGEICVNVLKKDWKSTLGLSHVLTVIRCLLIQPFPDSALNEEAGKMLMEDYEGYARYARLMTSVHAEKPRMGKSKEGAHIPLTTNMANTTSDIPTVGNAALKPETPGVPSNLEKKKIEMKKKSLRRL